LVLVNDARHFRGKLRCSLVKVAGIGRPQNKPAAVKTNRPPGGPGGRL